jgi:hypothetical protein
MGDRKPFQFLRHLRNLAPDIPDNYQRILWNSGLPTNVQVIVAGMPEVGLDAPALCADRIFETVSPSTVASISPGPDHAKLVQTVRDLSGQVASLVAERKRPNSRESRPSFRGRRPRLCSRRRSNSRGSSAGGLPLASTPTKLGAGTTGVSEIGPNGVPSPAPSARRETRTPDVSGGTRLHLRLRPPLQYRQGQQASVPARHGLRPLRVPAQALPSMQITSRLLPLRGCHSASTWGYAGTSRGDSWWLTSRNHSLRPIFSRISAS